MTLDCPHIPHLHRAPMLLLLIPFTLLANLSYVLSCSHRGAQLSEKLHQPSDFSNPKFWTSSMIRAQKLGLEQIKYSTASNSISLKQTRVRPMTDKDYEWMQFALAASMSCYGPCPILPYGSVLVDPQSNTAVMHACNTVYMDATAHAEMNTLQLAAHFYPNRSSHWWNSLTLYTSAEPCPMCMAAARWVGIGKIIYGTSITKQQSLGWDGIDLSAEQINLASYHLSTRTTLNGPYSTSLTDPYFSWQFNSSYPCPTGCFRHSQGSSCTFV